MCLQLHSAAAAAGTKKIAAALAEVEETHRAAVARLKADVQRKASALNAAKAENQQQLEKLRQAQEEVKRLRGLLASSGPDKALQQELGQKQAAVTELTSCVQSLAELGVRVTASMHLGVPQGKFLLDCDSQLAHAIIKYSNQLHGCSLYVIS
jgi:hypothetical protein